VIPVVGFFAIALAVVLAGSTAIWRLDCLRAKSSLFLTEKALSDATTKIKEYGEDRVKRGDELAEMGGKIAWFTSFLNHIVDPPKLHTPLAGHRWRLVSTDTVRLIREVLSEISGDGDWDTFEVSLASEADRRRRASAEVRLPKRRTRNVRKAAR
jgi:hypothetical protein